MLADKRYSNMPEEHKEALANLTNMFPNISSTELLTALEANSFSVERTVNYLLTAKNSPRANIAEEDFSEVAARVAQVEEDERFARQLQSSFEREQQLASRGGQSERPVGADDAAEPPLTEKLKLYGRAAKAKFWELYETYWGDGSRSAGSGAGVQLMRSDGYSAVPDSDEVAIARRNDSEDAHGSSSLLRRHWNTGDSTSSTYRQAAIKRTLDDSGSGKKDK